MKQSEYFIPTLKEAPSEAVIPSHQLMVRAGLIRQIAGGVFSFLPMGYKILKKAMDILREEMDAIGGQEFLLPALNPIEIWEETGRVEAMGDVMFKLKNRENLVLAPTHEEIITYHAKQSVKSYRDLPQIWYQIQTKFRNEPRPKSGVLRGRQFIMKDAYSLDVSWEALDKNYEKHYEAYKKIFSRYNLRYFIVGASSGAMGGSKSQEFMVESDAGEDNCAICDECGYAANMEVAESKAEPLGRIEENEEVEKFPTPNAKTIDDLVEQFGFDEKRCAKSVVYIANDKPVLIFMRGNDELNETKLQSALEAANIRPAESKELIKYTGADHGSIGPINLKTKFKVIADNLLKDANGLVSGANEDGYHYKNIDFKRDCKIDEFVDLRTVKAGEKCPKCGAKLRAIKAIEMGHIFKLGTKYSEGLNAKFLDSDGKEKPIIMGSYGIGVERILAAFIEQNKDDYGIIWKPPLAPFHAHIIGLSLSKFEHIKEGCEKIYEELKNDGLDILFDDRDESPGIKFNDADLIGIPIQIIVGKKNFEKGNIEIKYRESGERKTIPIDDINKEVKEFYAKYE